MRVLDPCSSLYCSLRAPFDDRLVGIDLGVTDSLVSGAFRQCGDVASVAAPIRHAVHRLLLRGKHWSISGVLRVSGSACVEACPAPRTWLKRPGGRRAPDPASRLNPGVEVVSPVSANRAQRQRPGRRGVAVRMVAVRVAAIWHFLSIVPLDQLATSATCHGPALSFHGRRSLLLPKRNIILHISSYCIRYYGVEVGRHPFKDKPMRCARHA